MGAPPWSFFRDRGAFQRSDQLIALDCAPLFELPSSPPRCSRAGVRPGSVRNPNPFYRADRIVHCLDFEPAWLVR